MSDRHEPTDQPVGYSVDGWTTRPVPPSRTLVGRVCRVEPLDPDAHASALHAAFAEDENDAGWTYLPYGPFADRAASAAWLRKVASRPDPSFRTIVDLATDEPVGVASLMRIDPANGVVEVGNIHFSPRMQRTTLATEALSLMMRHVFDELGYRRHEWKCDALNAPSRRAAERLGFTYEGLFRQAIVYKGRNRDTAWYSIIDAEWPAIRAAHDAWLAPANFDADGRQKHALGELVRGSRRRAASAGR